MSVRRITKELSSVTDDSGIKLIEIVDDNIMHQRWCVDVDFEDEKMSINLDVKIPPDYPFKAPSVLTEKDIFHPNVLDRKMCLGTTNNWHPKTTIKDILTEIKNTMTNPNLDTALFTEAANILKSNRTQYIRLYKKSLE